LWLAKWARAYSFMAEGAGQQMPCQKQGADGVRLLFFKRRG
jgi:hypothetical protein